MDSTENKNSLINELTIKLLSGEINDSEKAELESLLKESENRNIFNSIKEAWIATSLLQPTHSKPDTDSSWNILQNHIQDEPTPRKLFSLSLNQLAKIAALAIILIGATIFFTLKFSGSKTDQTICKITTPLGSRSYIVLPDGSQVWLNAGTTLKYPVSFSSEERNVYLTGEAYFKVKTDPKHPFVVHYSDVKIKAFGTEFNVKAYPEENFIETTLIKGIVKVEGKDEQKKNFLITMQPKQKVTLLTAQKPHLKPQTNRAGGENYVNEIIIPESIPVKPFTTDSVKTVLYTSWKDSKWVFEGTELSEIAVLLERRYNVQVEFNESELKNYTFTGTFQEETLDQVLEILKITTPVRYQMIGKGVLKLSLDPELIQKYKKYTEPK